MASTRSTPHGDDAGSGDTLPEGRRSRGTSTDGLQDDDGVGQASNGEVQLAPTHGSGLAGQAGGADDEARPDRAAAQREVATRLDAARDGGSSTAADQAAADEQGSGGDKRADSSGIEGHPDR